MTPLPNSPSDNLPGYLKEISRRAGGIITLTSVNLMEAEIAAISAV
jgi:hypothetical protein